MNNPMLNPDQSALSKEEKTIEKFQMDKIYYNPPIESSKISFDYNEREIDKQFINEQKNGINLLPSYPNRWIESFDNEGNPIYNSRENKLGVVETFIEPKARFSYSFNKEKIANMDGIVDPDDYIDDRGKTLKEIYDNSFVDFKKLTPKEIMINDEPNTNKLEAASNLQYITPDTWVYQNERPENGGQNPHGIFASDPSTQGSDAVF
jgi:hypothetical protein